MRATSRSAPVYRITGAQTSLSDEQRGRARRYLWSMGVRTVCFLGAIAAHGALRWVLVAAALVLPWVSVVTANAGREPDRDAPPAPVPPVVPPALAPGGAVPEAPERPVGDS